MNRTEGPLICPYCGTLASGPVKWLGQAIACPKCHGQFLAPGGNAGTLEGLRLLQGLVALGGGIGFIALARGCF